MLKKTLFFALVISCLLSTNASAKWWIFGQSDDTVATRYLYLNDISFTELDEQVTLYKDMLPDGHVIIRGKAQSGKSMIGKVEISLDDKETWQKADKSADGSFEFSFVPELERTYKLYVKILDTSGKSNEVDKTYREVTVSNSDIDQIIREALDAMISAYRDENPRGFMTIINDNFAGGYMVLDRAVRKDFTAFDSLILDYTLNNVASGAQGKVFVALTYNRQVTSTRSGETLTDNGLTEFIFNLQAGKAQVTAMKNPLLFGLSEAEEVATGTVNSGENDEVLFVDALGGAGLGPVGGGDGGVSPGGGGGVPPGGSGVDFPFPDDLQVTLFRGHHDISLSFNLLPDVGFVPGYEVVLEESVGAPGLWSEVYRQTLDSTTISNFTSDAIAQGDGPMLYYRIIIERVSDGAQNGPSNIVSVDNS